MEVSEKIVVLRPAKIFVQAGEKAKEKIKKELERKRCAVDALSDKEKKVYEIIKREPCTIGKILYTSGFEISQVNCALTVLELKHLINVNNKGLWECVKDD